MSETTKYCHRCEDEVKLKKDPASNAMRCSVCGTILVHSANHLPQGTILNGFEIINEIGRGGMGIVYNANQLNLDRRVALKVLSDDLANDDEFVERFFKEARAAASLNHPNIVQVFDAGSTLDGIYYFAMELVPGETLEDRIEKEGAFPPKEALKIAVKISDAMDYVWKSRKLTHGDIKPENIILNESGEAKLADLGLAKFKHEQVSTDGIMVTPLYAPPEIIKGENHEISFKSDMYSFGATLYQMLSGEPPFPDGPPDEVFLRHLNDTPPLLTTYNERFAAPLVKIVSDLLDKNPDKRPESWETLCKSLRRIKDPEGSGKIFHTRSHLHDTRDEVHSNDTSKRDVADGDLPPPESMKSISLLIKSLSAVALVLLVAIAVVVSIPKNSPKKPVSSTTATSPVAIKSDPTEEWHELKRRMNVVKNDKALILLTEFVDKHGDDCPPAALKHLKKMRAAIKLKERRSLERQRFAKDARNTEKTVLEFLKTKTKATVAQLQSHQKKVGSLLTQSTQKQYLKLSQQQYRSLSNSLMLLTQELSRRSDLARKQMKERMERERLKKLARKKQSLAQIRRRRLSELASAATADSYYKILTSYQQKRKLSLLEKELTKLRNESKTLSAPYSSRVDFLLKTVIPNSRLVYGILKNREKDLISKHLPRKVCSDKLADYTIQEISENGIKLNLKKGKVFLGHTLKWSKISSQKMVAFLKDAVLDNKSEPPSLKDERIVLAYAVLKAPDVAGYLLTSLRTLKHDEIQKWQEIIRDMNEASSENELVALYSSMKSEMKAGKTLESSNTFIKLISAGKDSMFAERYAKELLRLKPAFARINPEITASDMIEKSLSAPKTADVKKTFNGLMTIYARYGNVIPHLDRLMIKEFTTRREEVLATMVLESGVTEMKERRVPFYYWIKERQGSAWAFFKLAERIPRIKSRPKLLSTMEMAASLDNGDWKTAKEVFADGTSMSSDDLASVKRLRSWAPSFLFAKGLIALQYGDSEETLRARDILKSTALSLSRNKGIAPLATALAMEFAILCRDYAAAIKMGDEFPYSEAGGHWITEARVALLAILARSSANKKAMEAIQAFAKRFGKNPRLTGDIVWLRSASRLISGHPLSPPQIRRLTSANCYFSDTTARIMSSALAQYYVERKKGFKDELNLISSMEARTSPSLVAGDLWRRTLLLRLGQSSAPKLFAKTAARRLGDLRISSMRAYPFLLELQTGAEVASGGLSPESAQEILVNHLKASLLVGKQDISDLDVITSANPSSIIKRLFLENRPVSAIRAALLALATHKKATTKVAISAALKENAALLQWEELNALRVMERWR